MPVPLLTALSTSLLLAVPFYPALRLGRSARLGVVAILGSAIALTPLLIPTDHPFLRFLAAVFAVILVAKLFDLHIGADQGHRPDLATFLAFLPNLGSGVLRRLGAEPRPSRAENLIRLGRTGLASVVMIELLVALFRIDWRRFPFALEHTVKVSAFFVTLIPTAAATASVWRLLGWTVREPMDRPLSATTPAEFWRRYNRLVQQFLHEDVFKPFGGRRRPFEAAFATFAISALLHEYAFDIAAGRVQGYQSAFFLLQGLAASATVGVRPRGWRVVPWMVATLAFNLASTSLFFASMNEVVPFYCQRASGS